MTGRPRPANPDSQRRFTTRVPTKYLIDEAEQPRVRRATDLTAAAFGGLVLWLTWLSFENTADIRQAAAEFVDGFPVWSSGLFTVMFGLGGIYVVTISVLIAFQGRARIDVVRDLAVAAGLAVVGAIVAVRLTTSEWPQILPELDIGAFDPQYPVIRVAVVTAVVVAVSPHVTRPLRRLGWAVVIMTAFAAVALGYGLASSSIGGLALGLATAKLVLFGWGSPSGYPDIGAITSALADLGLTVTDLQLAEDQSWGVRRLSGWSEERGRVEVKAYGRDATDSQVAARLWRYLWYRESESSLVLTRIHHVEHEALVTVLVGESGASAPGLLAAGLAGDDVAILAVSRPGVALSEVEPDSIGHDHLVSLWRSVDLIHRASIAHGALGVDSLTYSDSGFFIGDFAAGRLSAPRAFQLIDVARLLFGLSTVVGVQSAVRSAEEGLGPDALGDVMPYLQLPAMGTQLRRSVEDSKELMERLRQEVGRVTAADPEEKLELRRVSPRRLIVTGLSLFAAYILITQLSDIDFASVWDELQEANWVWIVSAFVFSQVMYLPEATSMLAAVGYPLPLKPLVILQSATKFAGLALSSTAARVTINTAFLRKYGVSFTASVGQAAVESVAGLIVEALILITTFLLVDIDLDLGSGETEWGLIIGIIALAVVVVLVIVWRSERVQELVLPAVKEGLGAFADVLRDPKRALALFGSNLASRVVLAIALWMILTGFGISLGLLVTLATVVASSLLAGLVPVPGGVGVTEAVITAALVFLGVPESIAFAAAVVYRMTTYYLPAAAGLFSMRWLDKNGHI